MTLSHQERLTSSVLSWAENLWHLDEIKTPKENRVKDDSHGFQTWIIRPVVSLIGVQRSIGKYSGVIYEKAMAPHSSFLAWRIPGMEEPGGLPSMGSHRVGHDWSDLAAAAAAVELFKTQILELL